MLSASLNKTFHSLARVCGVFKKKIFCLFVVVFWEEGLGLFLYLTVRRL